MPTVTSTVGPGKTYATLAAWVAGRTPSIVSGTGEVANCFSGADLGACTVVWDNGAAITSITADISSRHNGKNAGHMGVAYTTGPITLDPQGNGSSTNVSFMRIEDGLALGTMSDLIRNVTVKSCLFAETATPAAGSSINIIADGRGGVNPDLFCLVSNNIIYWNSSITNTNLIQFTTGGDGSGNVGNVTARVYNNSITSYNNSGSFQTGIDFEFDVDSTSSIDVENNIVISLAAPAVGDYSFTDGGSGATTIINANNLSSDSTATSFGTPTGCIINAGSDGIFVDSTSDVTLLRTSPAKDAGMTIAGTPANPDAIGVTRPQGPAWDMGALELVLPKGGGGGGFWPHWWYVRG